MHVRFYLCAGICVLASCVHLVELIALAPNMPAKKPAASVKSGHTAASSASASASRIGSVMSKFGGGKSNRSTAATSATENQAESKRAASKRFNILANASTPQNVKDKWAEIRKLAKGQNKAKQDFTTVLFKDVDGWSDAYWQASANESHSRKTTNTAEWMLRSKAVHDHGGGQAGEAAIDDAVAAGIYEERCVFSGKDKFGKPISIKQIRVTGERSDRAHTAELLEKVRVGTAADADTFKKALTNMAGGVSIKDQPKKQKQPALAAIEDNKPPSVASGKKPAAATPKAGNVIRTMMKGVSAKRPAAAAPRAAKSAAAQTITEEAKKKHDEEQEAQQTQLNKCLENALKQINATEMKARKLQAQAKAAGAGTKLQEVHTQELARCISEIAVAQDRLKEMSVGKDGAAFEDKKVDLLETSSALLQETKDIMSVLTKTVAPKAGTASGSQLAPG